MPNQDQRKRSTLKISLIRRIILYIALSYLAIIWYYHYYAEPYHMGYQYKPSKLPLLASIFQISGKYWIEYVPDNLKDGCYVRLYVTNASGYRRLCHDCILSGYYIRQDGVKKPIFKAKPVNYEGIGFFYPGKQVIIEMEHEGKKYKFYIPKPSLLDSFIRAIYDNPYIMLVTIVLPIVDLIIQTIKFIIKNLSKIKNRILIIKIKFTKYGKEKIKLSYIL